MPEYFIRSSYSIYFHLQLSYKPYKLWYWLTLFWFISMRSCLVAWSVGCAQGDGSCQWRLRSNPIREHLKRVRINMWGGIRLYEVKDIWIMVVWINITPSLHSFTLCLIPFCEVKDIWIMVVWINARLSTNYICFVLSYFQTFGDLLHLCRNHGCPWWLVNCWLLNVNPLVKSS